VAAGVRLLGALAAGTREFKRPPRLLAFPGQGVPGLSLLCGTAPDYSTTFGAACKDRKLAQFCYHSPAVDGKGNRAKPRAIPSHGRPADYASNKLILICPILSVAAFQAK